MTKSTSNRAILRYFEGRVYKIAEKEVERLSSYYYYAQDPKVEKVTTEI